MVLMRSVEYNGIMKKTEIIEQKNMLKEEINREFTH